MSYPPPAFVNDTPDPTPLSVADMPVNAAFIYTNSGEWWWKRNASVAVNLANGSEQNVVDFGATTYRPYRISAFHFANP